MEVTAGYKQTDAGVIPTDWNVAILGDKTLKVGSGITPTGGERVYKKEGRPFLRSQNVGWGNLLLDDIAYISNETHETFKSTEIEIADVFLNITGASIGRSAIADARVANGNVNQHVCIVRTKQAELYPTYLNYFLLSRMGQQQIDSFQAGGNRQGLNFEQIRSFLLPLPPLAEQRAIAAALSDTDALLSGLDSLIAKKRDIKQAVMQQLLTGALRLPGFESLWEVKRFGELGKCLRGVSYKGDSDLSPHDTDHTIRLLRSNNVQNAAVVTKNLQFVNNLRVSSQQIMHSDDILICMANGSKELVGKAGLFNVSDGYAYTFGAFMGCYRTNVELASPAYVFFLFQTGRYRQFISNLLAGSSINNLRPSVIEELEFQIPEIDEQAAIAAVLSDMDAELAALIERRDKTRALKQGMMQELLTGRVRLV